MKILEFLKKHWRAAVWTLGALGLGLGTFKFFRRFRIRIIDVNFRDEEMLFEHVRLIQEYHVFEDAKNDEDHQQYLNTAFYPDHNLVILVSYFNRKIFEESYLSMGLLDKENMVAMSDDEITIPTVYCEDANIKKVSFIDGAVLYVPEYNVEFEIIDEGDLDYDIYK